MEACASELILRELVHSHWPGDNRELSRELNCRLVAASWPLFSKGNGFCLCPRPAVPRVNTPHCQACNCTGKFAGGSELSRKKTGKCVASLPPALSAVSRCLACYCLTEGCSPEILLFAALGGEIKQGCRKEFHSNGQHAKRGRIKSSHSDSGKLQSGKASREHDMARLADRLPMAVSIRTGRRRSAEKFPVRRSPGPSQLPSR